MAVLTHRWVSSGALAGKAAFKNARVAVVMHGIMGSGRNWMTPAKKLVDAFPSWKVLLVDHRGHGERARDAPPPPPHTIDACAADLEATIAHATGARAPTPSAPSALLACGGARIVCGHSFGGKVALAYAARRARAPGLSPPTRTWLFDSRPGARAADAAAAAAAAERRGSVGFVLAALERAAAREPFASRRAAADALVDEGVDAPTAAWLATSTKPAGDGGGGGVRFTYALPVVRAMFDAYQATDLWADAAALARDGRFGLVAAGRGGQGIDAAPEAEPLRAAGALWTIPDASHNLHVDSLPELLRIVTGECGADWEAS